MSTQPINIVGVNQNQNNINSSFSSGINGNNINNMDGMNGPNRGVGMNGVGSSGGGGAFATGSSNSNTSTPRKPNLSLDEVEALYQRTINEPHNHSRPNLANPFAGLGGPHQSTPQQQSQQNPNNRNYSANSNSTPSSSSNNQPPPLPLLQQQLILQQQHQQHLHQQQQMQQHQQLQQQQQFQNQNNQNQLHLQQQQSQQSQHQQQNLNNNQQSQQQQQYQQQQQQQQHQQQQGGPSNSNNNQQQQQQNHNNSSRSFSIPQQSSSLTSPLDGGPPYAVPIRTIYTRTSLLPPGEPFPSISTVDQEKVKEWMERDQFYEKELSNTKKRMKIETHKIGNGLVKAEDWLGAGDSGSRGRMRIRTESERGKDRMKGKRGHSRIEVKLSKEKLKAVALEPEILIPIRVEFEHEAYKIRDTFTWNLRENIITPEIFASHLIEDMRLPISPFTREIVSQIKKQIEDAKLTELYEAHLGDNLNLVREANKDWFQNDFKRRKNSSKAEDMNVDEKEDEKPLRLGDFKPVEGENEELRVIIKLDITLDSLQLTDKFEWDLSDSRNSPEDFADRFTADLALPGEFRTAIAHSIREQLDVVIKSLCLLGHVHGLAVLDDELRREFLPALYETFRSDPTDYTPLLNYLSPEEVDRNDKEREREVRRKRRQTKGRGVTLPDREHVKTHRTLVPKPSTITLQPYQDARGETVFPLPEISTPYPFEPAPIPEKPANLESVASSPLKLIQSKALPQISALNNETSLRPPSRLKKVRATSPNYGFEEGTSGEASTRAVSPAVGASSDVIQASVPSVVAKNTSPTKAKTAMASKPKRPPVIKLSLEEQGLHETMVNGVWHCSLCGIPASLISTNGKKKGPAGVQTLCTPCGKYWSVNKALRDCVYTTDIATHQAQKVKKEAIVKATKSEAKGKKVKVEKRTGTASLGRSPRPVQSSRQSSESIDTPMRDLDDSDDEISSAAPSPAVTRIRKGSVDLPFVNSGSESSLSSVSPPAHAAPQFVARERSPTPVPVEPEIESPPDWMLAAAVSLRAKHEVDRFEYIPKVSKDPTVTRPEWRIRCNDCPGKLYNIGPDQTLENFSVHFKNRQHRLHVEERIKRETSAA